MSLESTRQTIAPGEDIVWLCPACRGCGMSPDASMKPCPGCNGSGYPVWSQEHHDYTQAGK